MVHDRVCNSLHLKQRKNQTTEIMSPQVLLNLFGLEMTTYKNERKYNPLKCNNNLHVSPTVILKELLILSIQGIYLVHMILVRNSTYFHKH
jgi:hypothetical protein